MNKEEKPHSTMSRREFISRITQAGALIAGVGVLGYITHDSTIPRRDKEEALSLSIRDFSIPDRKPAMAIIKGAQRDKTIGEAFEALGGITSFIARGDIVLLKVNGAFATPASLSATTHPDLVSAVTTLCLKAGAAEVRVTDNPINDPESCFKLTGIGEAAETAGAKVILPRTGYFKPYTLKGGILIHDWPVLLSPLEGVTKLIGLAPVKDHHRSGASMTMKNWYGLLGGRRNIFHQDIHTIIVELAMMIRPTLVVLDGTSTMMTNGPTGGSFSDLKATDTMIVSTDQVAADAYGSTLLEKALSTLPYIEKAATAGCGTIDYTSLNPIVA